MQKRCMFCGRYFIPDRRVGRRQKACGRVECKRRRKQAAQRAWSERNPDYFKGRYWYVKEWRARRQVIQDEIPPSKQALRLVLIVPGGKKGVIQDEIRLRRVDSTTFAAAGLPRGVIQDKMDFPPPPT